MFDYFRVLWELNPHCVNLKLFKNFAADFQANPTDIQCWHQLQIFWSNKLTYYFGKSKEYMDLSRIYLAVQSKTSGIFFQIFGLLTISELYHRVHKTKVMLQKNHILLSNCNSMINITCYVLSRPKLIFGGYLFFNSENKTIWLFRMIWQVTYVLSFGNLLFTFWRLNHTF